MDAHSRYGIVPAVLALVLCLAPGCRQAPPATANKSTEANPTGKVPSRTDAPCRVAHLEWRDRSTKVVLAGEDGAAWLADTLGLEDGATEGWTLFLEFAIQPAEAGEGQFHYGIRAFLKDLNQIPSPVLEAGDANDLVAVPECVADVESEACRSRLAPALLQAPLRTLKDDLLFQCRVRSMSPEALGAALQDGTEEQLAVLAQTAGENGDASLVDALLPLLDHPSPRVRISAIAALGRLAGDDVVPQLARHAQGADESVVRAVMVALADIDTDTARRYLATWADHHPLTDMRSLAKALLQE